MLRTDFINKSLIILSYICLTAIVCALAFMLLIFPDNAGYGIKNGIELSLYTLIPSMFPFMFLSSFIINSGLCEKSEKLFSFTTEKIFRLPGVCGSLIILSMIGGLPIGARMAGELYDKKYITCKQGQRILLFCINPGPAFIITTVGYYMLGSKKAGIIIFVSLVISSLLIGFISKFIFSDEITEVISKKANSKLNVQSSVVASLTESSRGMLNVCSWVVLFSCFIEMFDLLPISDELKMFAGSVLEVTNGCKNAALNYPVTALAGIIGFGGICAHIQMLPSIVKLKLPLKYFLSARIINSGLSIIISSVLFDIFPTSVQTISIGKLPQRINSHISFPICFGVMTMCVLLLLGENFKFKKKSNKKIF